MKKQSWLARAFLLGVSLLSSIDAVSASWLITGDHTDNADTSASITTDDTKAVCYVKKESEDTKTITYYTSLDKALTVAESDTTRVNDSEGNYKYENAYTICVIPNLKNDDGTISPVEIKNSHTIKTGDSLVLPYAYENADKSVTYIACGMNVETGKTDGITDDMIHGDNNVIFADQDDSSIETYRQTKVVLGTGERTVNLTVNGNLLIGGKLSNPNKGVSGQTAGSYCEMVLSEYAHIVCSGSKAKIECDGYIKKSYASNTDNYLHVNCGGTLKTPLVIYDFKGGTFTAAAPSAKISPFYVFDFPNVQAKAQVDYESYWETKICVYAESTKTYFSADGLYFLAPSTDDLKHPIISQESGATNVDYVPAEYGHTSKDVDGTKTTISLSGKASIGSLNFTYEEFSLTIDSSDFYLPISYRFDFELMDGCVLNSPKKIKFMNGSSVKIDKGATLNVTAPMAIYGADFEDTALKNNKELSGYVYPSAKTDGTKLGGASFVNNGTLNVTDDGVVGGIISTTADTDSAVLNYQTTAYTVESPEVSAFSKAVTAKNISCTAEGAYFTLEDGGQFSQGTASYKIQCNYYCSAQKKGWYSLLSIVTSASGEDSTSFGSIVATANCNKSIFGENPSDFAWKFFRNFNDYLWFKTSGEDKSSLESIEGGKSVTIKNYTVSEAPVYVALTVKDTNGEYRTAIQKISVPGKDTPKEPATLKSVSLYIYYKDNEGNYTQCLMDPNDKTKELVVSADTSTQTTNSITINTYDYAIYSWKIKVVTDEGDAIKDNKIQYKWYFSNMKPTSNNQTAWATVDGEPNICYGLSTKTMDASTSASAIEMNFSTNTAKNPIVKLQVQRDGKLIIPGKISRYIQITFKTKSS